MGIVKINVDALLVIDGWVDLGMMARDSHGTVLFAAITRLHKAYGAPEVAEAKALALGVRLGKCFRHKEVIIEYNCQMIINRLSNNAIFLSNLDSILRDILASCTSFTSLLWSHVLHDGTFVES